MTKALVLEENPLDMELVLDILNSKGFIAHGAKNGKEAIKMAENELYDLIIMNVELSEMDCIQVAEIIRSKPSYKDVAVVALTAYAMKRDKEKVFAAGFDDYIPKPINVSDFLKRIEVFRREQKHSYQIK